MIENSLEVQESLEPEALFDEPVLQELRPLEIRSLVNRPEDVPATEPEQVIELAELVLDHALKQEGHHYDISQELLNWVNDNHPEKISEQERRAAYNLGPSEISQKTLDKENQECRLTKAKNLLQWCLENYGEECIVDLKQQQQEQARKRWKEAFQNAEEKFEAEQFEENPPEQINGWTRIEPWKACIEIAWEGVVNGDHSRIVVYEDSSGTMTAAEFRTEDLVQAGGDPREATLNRAIISTDRPLYGGVKSHLQRTTPDKKSEA